MAEFRPERRVMIAIDGSDFSKQAFDFAVAKVFKKHKDTVFLLTIDNGSSK